MTEHRVRSLLREVASNAVPEDADLWPAIASNIERIGGRRRWPARHLRLIQALAVVVLALLLVAATPGRSVVGSALYLGYQHVQRFGAVLVGPGGLPGRSQPPHRAGAQPTPIAQPPVRLTPIPTLAEAQQQVAFHIRTPAWLPPGMVFRYVFVFPGADGVALAYQATDHPSGGMGIEIRRGAPASGYAIPSSAAQNVQVHGHPAVYAHGSWNERREWHGDADSALLSWEEDGFTYVLHYSGLGLSRTDMIRIAESLQ